VETVAIYYYDELSVAISDVNIRVKLAHLKVLGWLKRNRTIHGKQYLLRKKTLQEFLRTNIQESYI
jgi:hypothetical protein